MPHERVIGSTLPYALSLLVPAVLVPPIELDARRVALPAWRSPAPTGPLAGTLRPCSSGCGSPPLNRSRSSIHNRHATGVGAKAGR